MVAVSFCTFKQQNLFSHPSLHSHRCGRSSRVEATAALLTQLALLDEVLEQLALLDNFLADLARRDPALAPALCNVAQRVEAHEVRKLKRTHWVARAELHGCVNVLDAGVASLDETDGLEHVGHQEAVDDEAACGARG